MNEVKKILSLGEICIKILEIEDEKIKEKEIIYWSKKHYERELHQNEKFLEYLESCKLKDKQRKS